MYDAVQIRFDLADMVKPKLKKRNAIAVRLSVNKVEITQNDSSILIGSPP
jgi:hypothetical protein